MKVTGKTLISMGYRPGKWFGEALDYVNRHALSHDEMVRYLDALEPHLIDPHAEPRPYHKNIRADSPEEVDNVAKVFATMETLMRTQQ